MVFKMFRAIAYCIFVLACCAGALVWFDVISAERIKTLPTWGQIVLVVCLLVSTLATFYDEFHVIRNVYRSGRK